MCNVKPIRTEADFKVAMARIEDLMDAEFGSPEGEELDLLADLAVLYEYRHEDIADPGAGAMIEFWIDQRGWTVAQVNALPDAPQDIAAVIAGKAALKIRMALLLHEQVGIPEEYLLVNTLAQPALAPAAD